MDGTLLASIGCMIGTRSFVIEASPILVRKD